MLLCEDNAKLAQAITTTGNNTSEALLSLKDRLDGEGVLACTVLHNIFSSLQLLRDAQIPAVYDDSILIPTLTKVIASVSADEATSAGENWSDTAQYQQLALETLASIGTSLTAAIGGPTTQATQVSAKRGSRGQKADDGDDEDMAEADDDVRSESGNEGMDEDGEEQNLGEDEQEEGDDEMTHEEMQADMDLVLGTDEDDDMTDDLPVLKPLLQLAIPELIRISSIQPSNEIARAIKGHALSAVNNIAWSLSLVDFSEGDSASLLAAWAPAATAIWEQLISPILASDTADLVLATRVTGLAWAVARVLRSQTPLQPSEHQKFIALYHATKGSSSADQASNSTDAEDPFQSLGVKCVGVLGELALDPCPIDRNRQLGTFLVTVVSSLPETPAADAVEALNQLFDIYGEEEYAYDNAVFWADNFAKHLEAAVPKVRTMVKSVNKKTQAELRLRADESLTNLTRFLAYKAKNKPKN